MLPEMFSRPGCLLMKILAGRQEIMHREQDSRPVGFYE
jgi:hypothetical protein